MIFAWRLAHNFNFVGPKSFPGCSKVVYISQNIIFLGFFLKIYLLRHVWGWGRIFYWTNNHFKWCDYWYIYIYGLIGTYICNNTILLLCICTNNVNNIIDLNRLNWISKIYLKCTTLVCTLQINFGLIGRKWAWSNLKWCIFLVTCVCSSKVWPTSTY